MFRFLNIFILLLLIQGVFAQSSNYFLVNLAIEENSTLNFTQHKIAKELLFKKLTSICSKVEGVIIDEYSDYFLVSDIYSTQSQVTNAGFLPVGVYKMNLRLKLIYKTGGKAFKELNFSKDYVVNSDLEAIQMLINDFSFAESELNDLFIEGAKKMKSFYTTNCISIFESAKKYQSIGEPEKALALCLSIPSDMPCFNNVSDLTKVLYTSLSYKSDYAIFLRAQDFVSKGEYEDAFSTLNEISIYSQFYVQAQTLGKQINDFIFSQKELHKKKELAESEQKLKETEIVLQQKRNELQESINQTNIELAFQKNESDRQIALQQQENQKEMKGMELRSQERKEMIKTAGNLLGAFINRPKLPENRNFYIIK